MPENEKPEKPDENLDKKSDEDIFGPEFDQYIEKKKKENKVYDLIGKRIWKQEQKLYNILKELFPDNYYIRRHDRRTLNGLELDFNLPELRLGIEYDGEQHFDRKLCEEVFKIRL